MKPIHSQALTAIHRPTNRVSSDRGKIDLGKTRDKPNYKVQR
jgi:hypothetical protein